MPPLVLWLSYKNIGAHIEHQKMGWKKTNVLLSISNKKQDSYLWGQIEFEH